MHEPRNWNKSRGFEASVSKSTARVKSTLVRPPSPWQTLAVRGGVQKLSRCSGQTQVNPFLPLYLLPD